jgi:putative FmdB family regulatory protein
MPIYEFRCDACASTFEKFQRTAGGDSTAPCPACGAPAGRQLSLFATPRGASSESAPSDMPDLGGGDFGMGHDHGHGHGHSHGPGGHSH